MAKFKVGDKVTWMPTNQPRQGTVIGIFGKLTRNLPCEYDVKLETMVEPVLAYEDELVLREP